MMRMDRLCFVVMTTCLFSAGCFSYGPYGQPGPYGTVPHTAMGPQPMIGGAPAGTVWIPATPNAASGVGLGPATVTAPEPKRRSTSEPVDHFEEPVDGKVVPEPTDSAKENRPVVSPMGYREETQVQPRNRQTSQRAQPQLADDEDVANSDREPRRLMLDTDSELADRDDQENSGAKAAEFKTRVRADGVQPASAERSNSELNSDKEDKYGYDAEGYTWLRGVVEFDRKHKTWHLSYDRSPDDADQFGGEVTFKHRPEFATAFRSGQVIFVEGHFDESQQDRLGKPVFEVDAYRPIGK